MNDASPLPAAVVRSEALMWFIGNACGDFDPSQTGRVDGFGCWAHDVRL